MGNSMSRPISGRRGRGARATRFRSAALGAQGAADAKTFTAAAAGVTFAEADAQAGIEEAPGFAIFFEHGAGLAAGVGIEANALALVDGLDGDDVPDIFGNDVGDEEIDFGGGVNFATRSGGGDAVAGLGEAGGGLDLNAKQSAVEFVLHIIPKTFMPAEMAA